MAGRGKVGGGGLTGVGNFSMNVRLLLGICRSDAQAPPVHLRALPKLAFRAQTSWHRAEWRLGGAVSGVMCLISAENTYPCQGGDKLAGGRAHPAAAGRPALFSAYVGLSKAKRPYLYQRRATDSLLYSNCRVAGVIHKIFKRIISVEFWIRRKLVPGNAGHGLNPATRPARSSLRAPGAEGN